MSYARAIFWAMIFCLAAAVVRAGDLDAPGAPGSTSLSKMYTLEDIFQRLDNNTQASDPDTDEFTEPSSGPTTGMGHTLKKVYEKAIPTQNAKSGQTDFRCGPVMTRISKKGSPGPQPGLWTTATER